MRNWRINLEEDPKGGYQVFKAFTPLLEFEQWILQSPIFFPYKSAWKRWRYLRDQSDFYFEKSLSFPLGSWKFQWCNRYSNRLFRLSRNHSPWHEVSDVAVEQRIEKALSSYEKKSGAKK